VRDNAYDEIGHVACSRGLEMATAEITELLVLLGHWARVDVHHVCEPEEYVAHEVIFLRALARFGDGATPTRGRLLAVTKKGLYEGAGASFVFEAVGKRILEGVDEPAREGLLAVLRTMKTNVVSLSRDREDPSRI
jgi:hypothetical protein